MTRTTAYVRPLVLSRFRAFVPRLAVDVRALAASLAMFAFFALLPSAARADSRTDFLVGRLQAQDFRVRTNAALALGQTGEDGVVVPLCGALADASDVVRQAAAVALLRLAKPASAGCLKDRLAV
jgi:HEAT repeat protein